MKLLLNSENYSPPLATVHQHQWYHGTLDRNESKQILQQFANSMKENYQPETAPADAESNQEETDKTLVSY